MIDNDINYNFIASSPLALADFLQGRLNCEACPAENKCNVGMICQEVLYKWLMQGISSEEEYERDFKIKK